MHLTDQPGHPVIILFMIAAASVLSSCELLRYYETKWDLEGEASFTGANTSDDVNLSAFFIDEQGGNLTPARQMVSNVVNLGTNADFPRNITLNIDISSFDLKNGAEIRLYMWVDANDDSLFDTGEDKSVCVPGAGCMVFNQTALAVFYFVKDNKDMSDGWYLNTPSGILAVEDAGLTGAELINNSAL
jgi:hypothetical protein